MPRLFIAAILACCVALPPVVHAQGRGRPKGPHAPPVTAVGGSASKLRGAADDVAAAPPVRQFGVWLDDATAAPAGEVRLGIGGGYWRAADMSLVDMPVVDLSYGMAERLQVAATLPFYHSTAAGVTLRGVDDVYVSGKVVAVDPTRGRSAVGVAISPVLEILTAADTRGRVHWALPVSVEIRVSPVRVYMSAGYFSRGALFGGGGLAWATPARIVVTGSLTQSVSSQTAGPRSHRVDGTVGLARALANGVSVYSLGSRTLRASEGEAAAVGLAAGLSLTLRARSF